MSEEAQVEAFRKVLVERLRKAPQEMLSIDPESSIFSDWLAQNCTEDELSPMAVWEETSGSRTTKEFLLACQREARN